MFSEKELCAVVKTGSTLTVPSTRCYYPAALVAPPRNKTLRLGRRLLQEIYTLRLRLSIPAGNFHSYAYAINGLFVFMNRRQL